MVQSQPGQIVLETLSGKISSQKRAGGVAEGVGLEFNPSTGKKKKKDVEKPVKKLSKLFKQEMMIIKTRMVKSIENGVYVVESRTTLKVKFIGLSD
jgi:hypothetical protein